MRAAFIVPCMANLLRGLESRVLSLASQESIPFSRSVHYSNIDALKDIAFRNRVLNLQLNLRPETRDPKL